MATEPMTKEEKWLRNSLDIETFGGRQPWLALEILFSEVDALRAEVERLKGPKAARTVAQIIAEEANREMSVHVTLGSLFTMQSELATLKATHASEMRRAWRSSVRVLYKEDAAMTDAEIDAALASGDVQEGK